MSTGPSSSASQKPPPTCAGPTRIFRKLRLFTAKQMRGVTEKSNLVKEHWCSDAKSACGFPPRAIRFRRQDHLYDGGLILWPRTGVRSYLPSLLSSEVGSLRSRLRTRKEQRWSRGPRGYGLSSLEWHLSQLAPSSLRHLATLAITSPLNSSRPRHSSLLPSQHRQSWYRVAFPCKKFHAQSCRCFPSPRY